MTAQSTLQGGISITESLQGTLTLVNDPTASTSAIVKAYADLTAVAVDLSKDLASNLKSSTGLKQLQSTLGAAGTTATVTAYGAAAYQLGEAVNDLRVAYESGASAAEMSQLRMNLLDKTLGLAGSAGNMLMLSPVPQLKVVGAGMWLLSTGAQQIANGNASQAMTIISKEFNEFWGTQKPSPYSLNVYGDPWVNSRSAAENIGMGLSPEGYPMDRVITIGEGDFATTFRVIKQGDFFVKTSFIGGTLFKSQIFQNEAGEIVKGEFSSTVRPGAFGKTYKVDFTGSGTTSTHVSGAILAGQRVENDIIPVAGTPYLEVTALGTMGSSIIETTNSATGATSYQLVDPNGTPVASGSNYTVAQNNSIAFDTGTSKQVYDLSTGRMMAQIDANGSGFVVGQDGNDTFYTAGQLSYSANSGVLNATVGGQTTQFFVPTNLYSLSTTTNNESTNQSLSDATSSGPSSVGNSLLSSDDYSASVNYSLLGDVNTAGGNSAIFNYGITDGLRPGNYNLGLNINASSGQGLKVPDFGDNDPFAYSLYGAGLNNAAASNFQLTPTDPLVLDLNGDGVKLTNYTDRPVLFDADNDGGSLEQTGWVSSADGIVVHDINGDGKINNISETLSEYYNGVAGSGGVAGTKPYANGFAALKSLDSNADNQFTSADAAWNNLRVWTDTNHDGKTDTGELKTFGDLGISAINLATTTQSGEVRDGNEVLARGSFTQSGQTKEAIAANFLANPAGSTITQTGSGITIATENIAGGAGNAGAITSFVSQNIVAAVNETLNASTLEVRHVTGGAGADTITGDAQNNWLAGGLGADKMYGGMGDDVLLIDANDTVVDGGAGLDIAQVVGSTGVTLNLGTSNIEIAVGGDGNDVFIGGGRSTVFVRGGAGDDLIVGGAANDVLSGEDGSDTIDGGAGNDLIRGHRGQDTLLGGTGDDVLDGGLEDDNLTGGAGNDVLIGGRGDDTLNGGDGIDVAQYSGSYGDYRITKVSDANGVNTFRVVDTRTGADGADTLTNVEKLSFSDVSRVDLTLGSPLPVKDILTLNSTGQALSRTAAHLLSKNQLLVNDRDWDSDVSQLSIVAVVEAKGGTATLTAQGDVLFTPDASYTGVMGFKYTVKDAQGNITTATNNGQTVAMKAAVYLQTSDIPNDPLAIEQWYLADTNVFAAWGTVAEQAAGLGYSGKGVKIGQFEPGSSYSVGSEVFDYRHPDLQPNADKAWLNTLDANGNSNTPQTFSSHATMVAGVMVAARNGQGGVGVAYNASLAGHYIQGEGLELNALTQEITTALAKFRNYDVVNNSWSASNNFLINVVPVGLLDDRILDAVQYGRGGLGTAIVMAGGNDRATGANTNTNALTANRAVITVGSINAPGDLGTLQLGSSPFSNPGASILVSAPGSNIDSTSRELVGDNGSTFGNEYNTSQGTSFAAPIVSGIIALMLEANPLLGYRDIQTILAMSATKFDDPNGTDWTYNTAKNWNGGGMHASHDYGFGKVDARAAVRLAETWYGQNDEWNSQMKTTTSGMINAAIPDGAGVLSRTLSMAAGLDVETAQVTVELDHQRWGDLIIKLISPSGTESILINRTGKAPGSAATDLGDANSGTLSFSFNTTHVRGEASAGNWTLQVIDAATGNVGTLKNWTLDLYGSTADSDDVYVYTNEFATTTGRTTLVDVNGGVDIINASAVTGNSIINLNDGATSTIAGKTLTVTGVIEKAFAGDGNDTLIGNGVSNILVGGRGNDVVNGGAGLDLLDGGVGSDALTGGADEDLFVIRKDSGATDTITDFNVASGVEKIVLVGFDGVTDFTQLNLTQAGSNVQIGLGNSQFVTVNNTTVAQLTEQNFTFVSDASMLGDYTRRWANPGFWSGAVGVDDTLLPNNLGEVAAFGLGGDDLLGSQTASDLIDGGNGNDTLWGEYPGYASVAGADWIEGGAGDDVLRGGGAKDRLVGGSGNDALFGDDGDDFLLGNTGVDFLDGGAGNDIVTLDGDFGTLDGTALNYYGTRMGGSGADVFKVLSTGGGGAGFTISGAQFRASNLIADFDPNQVGEKIDVSAFAWITSFSDLSVQTWMANGVPFARISVSSGGQSLNVNIYGVSAEQLNASHFVFAASTPGAVKGTVGNDTLTGDAGANTIDGLAGADSMTGRTGDDTYIVDNAGDTINELPGGGYDLVQSTVSYTLSSDVEVLTLAGSADLSATGNIQRNRLVGNVGNNRLDGGAEADAMSGGGGNDTYIVDNQLDTVFENVSEGTDTVESSVSWTLGSNVENLTLTGTGNVNATGNDVANTLAGNASDNILDGAQGADTMAGGLGNDTYYVDNAGDVVNEALDAGIDTVYSSVNLNLQNSALNVENAVLFGAATTLIGNALDNTLVGNSLANALAGGAGNDVLDGGAGADSMDGGAGDDTFFVDNTGDTVIEANGGGTDTVVSSINTSLATLNANLENLVLTGTANLSGTGNALANQISGNGGNNTLTGGAGNDLLDGGAGADALLGGAGDDTYYVDQTGDTVTEVVGEGTDTVVSSLTYTLGANLENLTLSGASNTNATGNAAANVLQGNSSSNVLDGGAAADSLHGNIGNDILRGGLDNDTYVFALGDGQDSIEENDATVGNVDTISFASGIAPASVSVNRVGDDLVLQYGVGDRVAVKGWYTSDANRIERVIFADSTTTWSAAQLAALVNDAPTGTLSLSGVAIQNQTLTATNTLADADGMGAVAYQWQSSVDGTSWSPIVGATANTFTLTQTQVGMQVRTVASYTDGFGTLETVASSATTPVANVNDAPTGTLGLSGVAIQKQTLTATNTLADADGVGAVAYQWQSSVDGTSWSSIVGATANTFTLTQTQVGMQVRTVASYTDGFGALETVTSAATTAVVDVSAWNVVTGTAGRDFLFGTSGVDLLVGGAGDDAYLVNNTNDLVIEAVGEGVDWVASANNYVLSDNVENLSLTGTAAINGTGNAQANSLYGNSASNVLDGGAGADVLQGNGGADTLRGGNGNDTYYIALGDGQDTIEENDATAGKIDTISFSYPVDPASVSVSRVGQDLLLQYSATDSVTVKGWYSGGEHKIEKVVFNDYRNTVWTPAQLETLVNSTPTGTVSIGGVVTQNQTLTATNTLVDADGMGAVAYQWQTSTDGTNWTAISGATASTLTLAQAQVGKQVRAVASYTDAHGVAEAVASSASVAVANVNDGPTGTVSISGATVLNQSLVASNTLVDADGIGAVAYQWQSSTDGLNWSAIAGATASTFTLTSAQVGAQVRTRISYTDGQGTLESIVSGATAAITGVPTSVVGTAGADVLPGTVGADQFTGLAGNDTYVVNNTGDLVIEAVNAGTDLVQSSINYALTLNVENLTLTGTNAINATGNALNNTLTGNAADNVLSGGAGADTMIGGLGNDTYYADNAGDITSETAAAGTDTVFSSVDWTLASNVENLALTGVNAINGTGNASGNIITGNAGSNMLDGRAGVDTLIGGAGNDSYTVDDSGDVVVENDAEGNDSVTSTVTYALNANVENLSLAGTANINGTGNALNNVLNGNSANNVLIGGDGNDHLYGGGGYDTLFGGSGNDSLDAGLYSLSPDAHAYMVGGSGDDFYTVKNVLDVVVENANEGRDTVFSTVSYTIGADVETLVLTGNAATDATGNASDNSIQGNNAVNTLAGGDGRDDLMGGGGDDVLLGGAGDDFLDLNPSTQIGNDHMEGGLGDDHFGVDSALDVVVEYANEGVDSVHTAISYALGANLENLYLDGNTSINGVGNDVNNQIYGNGANNTLDGGAGDDTLSGGQGDDALIGGAGNDLFLHSLGDGNDTIWDTAGTDTLLFNGVQEGQVTVSRVNGNVVFTLGSNDSVTAMAATGSSLAIDQVVFSSGTGFSAWTWEDIVKKLNHTPLGAVTISGATVQNQILTVANTLTDADGLGSLSYQWQSSADGTNWTNINGAVGTDLNLTQALVGAQIRSVVSYLDAQGTTETVSSSATAAIANVNDTPTGAVTIGGTVKQNETLSVTNTLADVDGLGVLSYQWQSSLNGVDWVAIPGATTSALSLAVAQVGSQVRVLVGYTDGQGTGESVASAATVPVASAINYVTGTAGADTLAGTLGADQMQGLAGNDTYVINHVGDIAIESLNEGTDLVQAGISYTLAANIENLTLTGSAAINGTGNTLNNMLVGNGAANSLVGGDGNDTLNGGAGSDTMIGGVGNDVYVVDVTTDVVVENLNEGTDAVQSSVTWTLGDNLENLTLTGSAAVNGTGNTLNNVLTGNSANNVLTGGGGNDSLLGGAGADTLIGGIGDDVYGVDSTGDVVTELANEGADLVQSSVTYSLTANVENLTLTGASVINGTGNTLSNYLIGNAQNNVLTGDAAGETGAVAVVNTLVIYAKGSVSANVWPSMEIWIEGVKIQTFAVNTTDYLAYTVTAPLGMTANNIDVVFGNDAVINGEDRNLFLSQIVLNGRTIAATGLDVVFDTGTGAGARDWLDTAIYGGGLYSNGAARFGVNGNDKLDGGAGADTLIGGFGNDQYVVDNVADVVQEAANAGLDTVLSSVTYTLATNVESLQLTGSLAIDGYGNAAGNTLRGNAGNNLLDGGAGGDMLVGGAGNDTYIVDHVGDYAYESANAGTDVVQSSVGYALAANIENLLLTGTAAINGTGNASANIITGNSAANTLNGAAGNDTLDGAAGADILIGGTGNDTYVMGRGYDFDTVQENDATAGNTDVLQFLSGVATDQLWFSKVSNNLEVSIIGTTDKATLTNWYLGNQYHVEQFKTSDGKVLLDSQVQNLVNAMAAFAPPAAGQTTLAANYATTLTPVIAANWQ